ncbi:MAG TPA: inner membrane CreD family protein, partial [Brevundimonas sp.]|nr:inner membrane CreD family protein [Brevundimonas sp.]
MARTPRTPPMTPDPAPQPVPGATAARLPRRSLGLKLLLVCGLALVMSIAALFVFALLMDRSNRAEQVAEEVGGLMGGPQTFLGPVLAVPYTRATATAEAVPAGALAGPIHTVTERGVW